jgi:hypothetical protein
MSAANPRKNPAAAKPGKERAAAPAPPRPTPPREARPPVDDELDRLLLPLNHSTGGPRSAGTVAVSGKPSTAGPPSGPTPGRELGSAEFGREFGPEAQAAWLKNYFLASVLESSVRFAVPIELEGLKLFLEQLLDEASVRDDPYLSRAVRHLALLEFRAAELHQRSAARDLTEAIMFSAAAARVDAEFRKLWLVVFTSLERRKAGSGGARTGHPPGRKRRCFP